jgi:fermentation-respiration switch protein FrsA (DUF1100 family)
MRMEIRRFPGASGNQLAARLELPEVIPIEHARRIYEAARPPKSFISLDRADHVLLNDPPDAEMMGGVLAAWGRRYAGAPS